MAVLVGDPGWCTTVDGDRLIVVGGADAVWVVDDIEPDSAAAVLQFWSPDPPALERLPSHAQPVIAHLTALGALRPVLPDGPERPISTVYVGDRADGFETAVGTGPPITVVVRTNGTLRDLVPVARQLQTPHVLCELAFHHTISFGPLVAPGLTACLACLTTRVGLRWGDPDPPPRPAGLEAAQSAGLLVGRMIRRDSKSLVNATVALDLDTLETRREPLWRDPACPVCAGPPIDGNLPLPWAPRR
jgi:bacteriocin biosynthesis cyclodehydratase domain-containing protein